MKYGYCDKPSINWKIEHGNGFIGVGAYGKTNVTLIRTVRNDYPLWYYNNWEHTKIRAWIDALTCSNTHIPLSASLGITLAEQFNWRPKKAKPSEGQIINYNHPCLSSQDRRKGIRLYLNCSMQGIGALKETVFTDAGPLAELALEDVSGVLVSSTWDGSSYNLERPLNDWHNFSVSSKFVTGAPKTLPEWTQIQISVNSLNMLGRSILSITEVTVFTDQSASDLSMNSVKKTLTTKAGVDNLS